MLQLINLHKIYKPKKGPSVRALDGVDLLIQNTGLVFVLGKSGSGKSTLLNVIGGLDSLDEGEMIINGRSSKTFKMQDFDSYRNTYIGFIFQEYNLLEEFNIEKNIAIALELQGKEPTKEKINEILQKVDLEGYANRKVNELSGGQKQRVAIARALIKDPQIIFADEPTGALDSNTGQQVFETLQKLSKEKLVIVVSHDRETAEKYGDRIIELKDGKVISDKSKTTVKNDSSNNFNVVDGVVSIDKDKEITKEQLEMLIAQLQKHDGDIVLTKASQSKKIFGETNQKDINPDLDKDKEFKLIKSKLKNTDALKIGASGLKYKKIRLFFTVLLSFISLAMFGLVDTIGSFNVNHSHAATIVQNGIESVLIQKTLNSNIMNFTNDEISFLQNENSNVLIVPYYTPKNISNLSYGNGDFENGGFLSMYYDLNYDFNAVSLTDNIISDLNYNLIYGTLPTDEHGILITDFQFYLYTRAGMFYSDELNNLQQIEVNEYSDIINKKLFQFKDFYITGIINTGFDFDKYTAEEYLNGDDYNLSDEFMTYVRSGLRNSIFALPIAEEGLTSLNGNNIYDSELRFKFEDDYGYYTALRKYIKNSELNKYHPVYFTQSQVIEDNEIMLSVNFLFLGKLGGIIDIQYFYANEVDLMEKFIINIGDNSYEFFDLSEVLTWFENQANIDAFKNELNSKLSQLDTKNNFTNEQKLYNIKGIYFPTSYSMDIGFNTDLMSYTLSDNNEIYVNLGTYSGALIIAQGNDNQKVDALYKIFNQSIDMFKIEVQSPFTYVFYNFSFLISILGNVFLTMGIVLAVFSSLLLMNFISISIANKKREIGVLRALGARGTDILKIFSFESLIIAFVNIALSVIALLPIISLINSSVAETISSNITFLMFTFRQFGLIVVISILTSVVASALPLIRISRKKPIDVINNK